MNMRLVDRHIHGSLTSIVKTMDDDLSNIFLQSKNWEPDQGREPIVNFENVEETLLPSIDFEKQLQNIMDCIIPPRLREVDGQRWVSRTSTVPATRLDLVSIEEKLENEMREGRAKEFGICPIRRHLYDQLFEELIRQVTVNCAERGLLLLRVKDELRMTLMAYQSVLESAIAYGLRKAIIVEKEQSQAAIERDEEKAKNKTLLAKLWFISEMNAQLESRDRIAQLEKQIVNEKIMNEDELETLEERMREENERLLESNKVLKNQLQAILQMDKMAGGADIPIENTEKKN